MLPYSGMMVIGADSKAGKSLVAMECIRAITTGENLFDAKEFWIPETGRVLYVEAEVGEEGLQKRGRKMFAGQDLELLDQNFYYVSKVPELQLHTLEGRALLEKFVDDVQPNVLILDPIGQLHGYDENDNQEIGRLFHTLFALIRKYEHNNMAVIVVHHMRKKGSNPREEGDPLSFHNFSGSRHFAADPDTLFMLNRLPEPVRSKQGHRAWKLTARIITRQGEQPDDMVLAVNEEDDLRVRFKNWSGGGPPKLTPSVPRPGSPVPRPPITGEQLMFPAANESPRIPRR
jgi:RecA-family ATPase